VFRFYSCFCSARLLIPRFLPAFLLAGILVGILPGSALATDTQKMTDKPSAAAKPPADPTCKVPGSAAEKTQPDTSSTDPGSASDAAAPEGEEAAPADDSMRIKSDLSDKPVVNEEAVQGSTQPQSTKEASGKSQKTSPGPQQCERPVPQRDLTLPPSGKNGSPE